MFRPWGYFFPKSYDENRSAILEKLLAREIARACMVTCDMLAPLVRPVQCPLCSDRIWFSSQLFGKNYKPGAYAYLSTKGTTMPVDKDRKSEKLRQLYYGPYKILQQLSPVSFQLQLPAASRIHDVFHCSLLKSAHDSDEDLGIRGKQLPDATDSGEYEVEKILTKRGETNHIQYLIKWKGYPMEDCSWEPASNLKNSKRILAAFENKHEIELQRRLL
jgi:hypothetical protein